MGSNEVKRWKKKTWLNVDVLYEDEFYARTPDLEQNFPATVKAKYTIVGQNTTRSTLEELPLDPPKEEVEKKPEESTQPVTEEKKDEETTKENPTLDSDKSPKV